MGILEQLVGSTNKAQIFLGCVAVLVAAEFLIKLVDYFRDRFGIETKSTRREKEQSETIGKLKEEVNEIKSDQNDIKDCLKKLQDSVNAMQKKSDMNKAAELKERIGANYRRFHATGKITTIEKESLRDLITAYSQFSDNSFVHSLVEKEMETWEVIDID